MALLQDTFSSVNTDNQLRDDFFNFITAQLLATGNVTILSDDGDGASSRTMEVQVFDSPHHVIFYGGNGSSYVTTRIMSLDGTTVLTSQNVGYAGVNFSPVYIFYHARLLMISFYDRYYLLGFKDTAGNSYLETRTYIVSSYSGWDEDGLWVPGSDVDGGGSSMENYYNSASYINAYQADGTIFLFDQPYFKVNSIIMDFFPPTTRIKLPGVLGLTTKVLYQDGNGKYYYAPTDLQYVITDAEYWND